jgi:hypothetical protein
MGLDVVDQLVRSSAIDIVVVDSVAALVPRAELEGDMGDMQMGLQARLMSKALRKITGSLSRSQTTVIFINQLRSKIGIMFGNPEVTAGGNALKFYSSVRIDVRRKELLKDNQGIKVRVKVAKNKVSLYVCMLLRNNLNTILWSIGGATLSNSRVWCILRQRYWQDGLPAWCCGNVQSRESQGCLVSVSRHSVRSRSTSICRFLEEQWNPGRWTQYSR